MILDIQAPNLSVANLLRQAQQLADSLGLRVHYDGEGRLTFTPRGDRNNASPGPIVSIPSRKGISREALQVLRKVQQVAPKGAIVATNGERIAVLSGKADGWRELML
jgi:hypothetical protein